MGGGQPSTLERASSPLLLLLSWLSTIHPHAQIPKIYLSLPNFEIWTGSEFFGCSWFDYLPRRTRVRRQPVQVVFCKSSSTPYCRRGLPS
jgi:hypothetical protein